ncbi:hypothetical protein [Neisseria dentiae]|nr:hypothetical protein [Neisseria dentiae]
MSKYNLHFKYRAVLQHPQATFMKTMKTNAKTRLSPTNPTTKKPRRN